VSDEQLLTVMILGDSLSMVCTFDPYEQGPVLSDADIAVPLRKTYPVLLHRGLSGRRRSGLVYVYNRSDRGYGAAYIERDIVYNALFCRPDILILHFGGNDCRFRTRDGRRVQLTPYSDFCRLLIRIRQALAFSSSAVITIGIAPPTAAREAKRPGSQREVENYNNALRRFSHHCNAAFIDISALIGGRPVEDFILSDGHHINTAMHELLSAELLRLVDLPLPNRVRPPPCAPAGRPRPLS
jgi:lysophospholipase L1-like esterase